MRKTLTLASGRGALALPGQQYARAICFGFVLLTIGQAHGQFETVLNIPPDPNIGNDGFVNRHTQLNLFNDGRIGANFNAGPPPPNSAENVEVNIFGGSVGDGFRANRGSTVNVYGGLVGNAFAAVIGSTVNIWGGSVGDQFNVSRATVNISGGSVGDHFRINIGRSVVNISGGFVGDGLEALDEAIVNITGGNIGTATGGPSGASLIAGSLSTVNMSGGSIGRLFAQQNSHVNLVGARFVLDGTDMVDSLTMHERFTIDDRQVTLSGLFSDGSRFAFEMNTRDVFREDFIDPGAVLAVTLVPLFGDTDGDVDVDIDDLDAVRNNFSRTGPADGTLPGDTYPYDGRVSLDDLNAVRNHFGTRSETAAVPEPSAAVLFALLFGGFLTTSYRTS